MFAVWSTEDAIPPRAMKQRARRSIKDGFEAWLKVADSIVKHSARRCDVQACKYGICFGSCN